MGEERKKQRNWNERQGGNEKKEEDESRESAESQRNNWIRQRERKRAVQRVFDKLAVYLAFAVNEAGCDDVLSPLHPSLRGRAFLARAPSVLRRCNWPFIAKGWDIFLSPNGFCSCVSPRLPLSSSFIQHQKDTPSTCPPRPKKKEVSPLGPHKAPDYHFCPCYLMVFPACSSGSACVATVAEAFQTT